jgi:hypothetical protein
MVVKAKKKTSKKRVSKADANEAARLRIFKASRKYTGKTAAKKAVKKKATKKKAAKKKKG